MLRDFLSLFEYKMSVQVPLHICLQGYLLCKEFMHELWGHHILVVYSQKKFSKMLELYKDRIVTAILLDKNIPTCLFLAT